MIRAISLGGVLFGLWLLLSGHYDPLLIGLGISSCILVVVIAHRMDVIDREGHPIDFGFGIVTYWLWLLLEIAKSNVDVARRILDPSLPISPTLIRVKASQRTELGRVIYANSITLTPGTVSIQLTDGTIEVHALTAEGAESLRGGEMNRRVAALEGAA
ncbi:Na+/H+ antiporter subunit E [Rhodospirillaceae bacterium SYSU D60014]|uniref:Na+/H+ antiporter subunit E n=1 Tax=Virgifigura deserti TaxID=2268457 RepID=UPI000E671781